MEAKHAAVPEPANQSESPHETQVSAPAPPKVAAQVQELPSKPKEDSHFRPAHDDFYSDIFYFSGMGSLIGSALASGVYVPEKNQRNALDADEVDQAKTRQENAAKRGEIVVTARNQAQGLSTDFRQLQALLETLPTFTDSAETKPYDRRAVDEPIHAHIYFSHEQKQQQQQRVPAQSDTSNGAVTQSLSSAQEQQTTKFSFPAGETASHVNDKQTASVQPKDSRTTSKPDPANQYPYHVQDRVTSSPYQHQPVQPSTHGTTAHDRYGSRAGGGLGSGILDSIDQFDRYFRAAEASSSSDLSFGSSAAAPPHPPPNRSSRQETDTTAALRQYANAADHGVTRPPVHQGRPTASPRPYADQRGGGGSVDSAGIKPWQLSHLRPLEAKGYSIVAEQERSFSHGGPRYGSDAPRGTPGSRSPYQQQQRQEEGPVVSVTARQTGSINHPYAATLEMPYSDL